jgi:hypothetical protein
VSALSNCVCLGSANSFYNVLLIRSLLTVTKDSNIIKVSKIYYLPVTNLKRGDTASYEEARRRDAPKGVSKKVSLLRTNR